VTFLKVLSLLLATAVTGPFDCQGVVSHPVDGMQVDPDGLTEFRGSLAEASREVVVEVHDRVTGRWEQVASSTSAATPTTIDGRVGYDWFLSLQLSQIPGFSGAIVEREGRRGLELRVRSRGAPIHAIGMDERRRIVPVETFHVWW
jgi:hypothetical protein